MAHAAAQETGAEIAARGTRAGAPACISCHGAQGEGNAAAGIPRLAGLGASYFQAQLAAFASGQRNNLIMTPIAKMLSLSEMQALATYFAHLPGPSPSKSTRAATGSGAMLALDGHWASGVPPCVSCHGPNGIGVGANFPPLAGQPVSYLAAQLEAWRKGERPPGPLGLMKAIAKRLTESEITAVSRWFAALGEAKGE
jgi:thiosulfate dehydrogenase